MSPAPADVALPFPRGTSYNQDGEVTITDTYADHLLGKTFWVPDTVHGSGMPVKLRIVRNDTGSSITATSRYFCMGLGAGTTSALDYGRSVTALGVLGGSNLTATQAAKPIDDAFPASFTIKDNDLFYIVEEGYCYVDVEATTASLTTAGVAVTVDTTGAMDGEAITDKDVVLGVLDEPMNSGTSTNYRVYITPGLNKIGSSI